MIAERTLRHVQTLRQIQLLHVNAHKFERARVFYLVESSSERWWWNGHTQ